METDIKRGSILFFCLKHYQTRDQIAILEQKRKQHLTEKKSLQWPLQAVNDTRYLISFPFPLKTVKSGKKESCLFFSKQRNDFYVSKCEESLDLCNNALLASHLQTNDNQNKYLRNSLRAFIV